MTQLGNTRADLRAEQARLARKESELQQAVEVQRDLRQQASESVIARERTEATLADLNIAFEQYQAETEALRVLPKQLAETQATLDRLQQENLRLEQAAKDRLDFQTQFGALQEKMNHMEQRLSQANNGNDKA